jgi:glucose dehydrogenase
LNDINTSNVAQLKQAWIWKTGETPLAQYGRRPGMFEDTPLMIDGVVYVTTPYNRIAALNAEWSGELGAQATFHGRLPLTNPPYGHITAIDLKHGTIAWQEPFGDWPEQRANPALKGVALPKVIGIAGPQGGIVTKGGIFFVGGEDRALHAIDKATAKDLWQGAPPGRSYGVPMTYQTRGGEQFAVIATGQGADAALVAFSL